MLRLSAHHRQMDCFLPPRGDANRNTEAPLVAAYMFTHRVQPGPVPHYIFFCLSACDTVLPYSLCGDPDGARREAQLPDYTPCGPPLSVPV